MNGQMKTAMTDVNRPRRPRKPVSIPDGLGPIRLIDYKRSLSDDVAKAAKLSCDVG